jgi:hypothetical protein
MDILNDWCSWAFPSLDIRSTTIAPHSFHLQTPPKLQSPIMSRLTNREKNLLGAARDMDIARKGMDRAQKKMRNAKEGIESAETKMGSAQEGFDCAREKLDSHHARIARKEDGAQRSETHGSSGETVKESTRTVRYFYSSPKTTDTGGSGLNPDQSQFSERTDTCNDSRRSGPRPEDFSPALRALYLDHRISAQTSQGNSGSGLQSRLTVELSYHMIERRPSDTNRGSSYDKEPPDDESTRPGASATVAPLEPLPSYHRQQSSQGRQFWSEPYDSPRSQDTTSRAPEGSRPPVSSPPSRPTTNEDPFRGRSDVPVSERSRYQSKQHTDSAGTQQTTLGAYNTTRRKSPHLKGEAIRRPEQSATPTLRSSQGTERLGQNTTASGVSDVTVKAPLTRDTDGSTRLSHSQPIRTKPLGPRRKRPKDTLGMPGTAQDPREGC